MFIQGNILFMAVSIFIGVIAVIVIGTFLYRAIRGGMQWSANEKASQLTQRATLVTKRTKVASHNYESTGSGAHGHSNYTSYYVTFEFDDRSRMEFKIKENDYGIFAESDAGYVTYQGTRFLGFERI